MRKTFIILTLMAVLVSGCGVQKRDPAEKKTFLLNIEWTVTAEDQNKPVCLSIFPCQIALPFSGRSLVYRTGPVQYEQDYYNLFLTSPDDQITEAMQLWVRQAGYNHCTGPDEATANPIILKPQVEALCADFQDAGRPVAVARMHFQIIRQDETSETQTFDTQTPLPIKPTAAEVVEGLSDCLTQIFQELENILIAEK